MPAPASTPAPARKDPGRDALCRMRARVGIDPVESGLDPAGDLTLAPKARVALAVRDDHAGESAVELEVRPDEPRWVYRRRRILVISSP